MWARRFAASFSQGFERYASHPLLLRRGFRGWNKLFTVSLIESPLIAGGSLLQGGSTGTAAAAAATSGEGLMAPQVSARVLSASSGSRSWNLHLPAALR